MFETAKSGDGTSIAFDRAGDGPSLVIVGGAFNTRHSPGQLVPMLTDAFTVITWDRRGRGDSGNTSPYSIERETDDLAAVIAATGGGARVYVAVVPGHDPMDGVQIALDAGDPSEAARVFMRGTGAQNVDALAQSPWWPSLVAVADTLPHDLALAGDGAIPTERLSTISISTLVMDGGDSPNWAANAAEVLSGALPNAERLTVEGQSHNVDTGVIAAILQRFFA
jgi:pimeloyl-ACP methyl ester carboxylesterase